MHGMSLHHKKTNRDRLLTERNSSFREERGQLLLLLTARKSGVELVGRRGYCQNDPSYAL